MATVEVVLNGGLTVGETTHTLAVLREATAGDVIEATLESERLVMVPAADPTAPAEPQLVISPALVGLHTLCRQLVRIGDIEGPISLAMLKKLKSAADIGLLQEKAMELEGAALRQVTERGRA